MPRINGGSPTRATQTTPAGRPTKSAVLKGVDRAGTRSEGTKAQRAQGYEGPPQKGPPKFSSKVVQLKRQPGQRVFNKLDIACAKMNPNLKAADRALNRAETYLRDQYPEYEVGLASGMRSHPAIDQRQKLIKERRAAEGQVARANFALGREAAGPMLAKYLNEAGVEAVPIDKTIGGLIYLGNHGVNDAQSRNGGALAGLTDRMSQDLPKYSDTSADEMVANPRLAGFVAGLADAFEDPGALNLDEAGKKNLALLKAGLPAATLTQLAKVTV